MSSAPQEGLKRVQEWEHAIQERELAEKRRRAPGWLDRDEKILEPSRVLSSSLQDSTSDKQKAPVRDLLGDEDDAATAGPNGVGRDDSGADLGAQMDKAFGGLG